MVFGRLGQFVFQAARRLKYRWFGQNWIISPIATEVILSRALAEPHLAKSIADSVYLAMKHEAAKAIHALDWIVPGKPDEILWHRRGNRLELAASWKNGIKIEKRFIYVPQEMIPHSARPALTTRPLTDTIDLPFCQRYQVLDEGLVCQSEKHVILEVFRDERDWDTLARTLYAIGLSLTVPGMEVKRAR